MVSYSFLHWYHMKETKGKEAKMRKLHGPAVKAIRKALGIPAWEFANDCGISAAYLSNIEAGRKQPTETVITAMAKRLGESKDSITYTVPVASAS